ncbi:hypothetical protein HPB50_022284 [Hyalomma asiaticum]|uniref:Uncharacterized protein n=1 Tax=Hyalomma asiaticum TaxID=266040 RepID=A0ACB7TLM8_HYAAI|nr:hypothetical protein HPB50_022284 [Hyalomma asiaticum]
MALETIRRLACLLRVRSVERCSHPGDEAHALKLLFVITRLAPHRPGCPRRIHVAKAPLEMRLPRSRLALAIPAPASTVSRVSSSFFGRCKSNMARNPSNAV